MKLSFDIQAFVTDDDSKRYVVDIEHRDHGRTFRARAVESDGSARPIMDHKHQAAEPRPGFFREVYNAIKGAL